ncbi:MAG: histidine phosphatase family protein [Bacteroidales bacterium]|nr:histidine phosphatase family protein [Bacteroidales bacterium]
MKKLFIAAVALAAACGCFASDYRQAVRDVPARAGGVYYAYPEDGLSAEYQLPKGYEPFYVSHYGRHGSRFLISDNDYKRVVDRLDDAHKAGALTPAGEKLRLQMDTIWQEARGRGGELTPLGARQHHEIAKRMATAYPDVFATPDADVTAVSTQVMRCAHSMFNFIDGLKELNPQLNVPMESSQRNLIYLSNHAPASAELGRATGPWYQDYKRFKAAKTKPERLMATIFSDKKYVDTWVDTEALMWDLYYIAIDLQNMETDIELLPLFTNDELFGLWEVFNFNFYACNSSYPRAHGLHLANARNLLRHIIENADKYIADGKHGATLRFGHDSNIIPLLALMKVEGCYSDAERPEDLSRDYADFYICPMATNLQLVFFRPTKGSDDVLVRILHNEKDAVLPVQRAETGTSTIYYRWSDLRPYLTSLAYSE